MDGLAYDADRLARRTGTREQPYRALGRLRGPILVPHPVVALLLAHVLAQQLARLRVEDADVKPVPLDREPPSDVARRQVVVGPGDLDAAIEMHGAVAELVVAEGFDRKRQQVRLLLGEHGRHLTLRRAVDPRVGPVRLPAIEVGLALLLGSRSEAHAACAARGSRRLDLAFPIWIAHPTRQRRHAVVGQHVAIDGIERRDRRRRASALLPSGCRARRPGRLHPGGGRPAREARPRSASSTGTSAVGRSCGYSPSVNTNSRIRRYLPVSGWRTIGPSP